MGFLLPWLRSDVRLSGRFVVQWHKGFEQIEGRGEELSADELIVSFPDEPPETPMRVTFEINGKTLAARIKPKKVFISETQAKRYRCVCKFVGMGQHERRQLDDLLENAPDPPYKRERIARPKKAPVIRGRIHRPENIIVPPEIEAKILELLLREKRIAKPAGGQRPLLAIKNAERVTEEGVSGTSYRVRSRMLNQHGVTKTFETPIFVPDKGAAQILT